MLVKVYLSGHRERQDESAGYGYTVFQVDVFVDGKKHTIEKRYSEFEDLHKSLKKIMKLPVHFPPKKLLNKGHKFIEERRYQLEQYMQCALSTRPYPEVLLNFLDIYYIDETPDATDRQQSLDSGINVSTYPFPPAYNVMEQPDSRSRQPLTLLSESEKGLLYPVAPLFNNELEFYLPPSGTGCYVEKQDSLESKVP